MNQRVRRYLVEVGEREGNQPLADCPPFFLGGARIDPPALRIEQGRTSQRVESKVMRVLLALARKPGEVVSRQDLVSAVWPGRIVTDDAVTNAIVKLRKALSDDSREPRVIETIAKSGYRLKLDPVPAVEDVDAQDWFGAETTGALRPSRRWKLIGALLLITGAFIIALLNWLAPREQTSTKLRDEATASIAVLPFEVLDDDTTQTYFAEGISLDVITELSRLPGLLVIAPGTVFGYRETVLNDSAIASDLGVMYLIRGAVQRAGDEVRINVRLLEAHSGQILWAKRFAGETSSLFQIQDEVVEDIARALPVRLALPDKPRQGGRATDSIAAYDEFLHGQERYGRRTPEDNRIARVHFERAVALDPDFARAYAGLALAWSRLAIDGWTVNADEALAKAAEFTQKAASIDPSIPQIHFVRAQVELFRGHHDQAAAAATKAIELDPNYADAYALLAWILHYAGRPDQAEPALAEALRRNPNASASYQEISGEIHFATGRFRKAARDFTAALERNPAHARARLWLAATLMKLGRDEDAAWEAQELLAINPEFSLSRLLLAFPLKDPRQLEEVVGALVQLGLPE